jgi:hypothetical protein
MDIIIYGFPAVAIVIGLTEVVKRIFGDKIDRFVPFISVIIGILLAVVSSYQYFSAESVVRGVVVGLVACGLWDNTKKTLLGK